MLEVKGIQKLYSPNVGIEDFSLVCNKGEIFSLIGPNGSGKSTVLKMILGSLKPDQGEVLLNQVNTLEFSVREKIGYLPENLRVGEKITAKELLYLVSDYKFKGQYKEHIEASIKRYKIEEHCHKAFNKLSMGTQKKIGIILAFMGCPDLIILDEPTNGIDTAGIIALKYDIIEAREKGGIVIISSHILDFVCSVSNKNIFLKDGLIGKIEESKNNLEDIYRQLYL